MKRVSIIIPTYYNSKRFKKCLHSLLRQKVTPDEIIVIYMEKDRETDGVIEEFKKMNSCRIVSLRLQNMSKMSAILNKGIMKSTGNIIVFIDEDIIPKKDWLSLIYETLKDNDICACGGKDEIIKNGERVNFALTNNVGMIKWKGFIVGNHHKGSVRRDVLFLKGCNMAVRKECLKPLDENLLGFVRWEQEIFFPLVIAGKRIVYDPQIQVFHMKDSLHYLTPRQTFWYGHNTVYLFCKYLKDRDKLFALSFFFLFGDTSSPGVLRFIHWDLTRNDQALCSFFTSLVGKIKGLATYLNFSLKAKQNYR